MFDSRTVDSRTRLRFRRPGIASWFADFPYRGRALYCTLRVSGNEKAPSGVMTPRETVEVTHTFPRFRIAIFHLVSHALPLAHRSVDCDVLSPTSSPPPPSPLCRSSSFLKGSSALSQFTEYRMNERCLSCPERLDPSPEVHAC